MNLKQDVRFGRARWLFDEQLMNRSRTGSALPLGCVLLVVETG